MAKKTDIRLRRSNVANAIPGAANLSDGELAMNTMDGALYFKKSDGTIITAHDNTIMHVDSGNDRIGIGTTSPGYDLDISGNIHATAAYIDGYIYHTGDSDTYINYSTDNIILSAGAQQYYFKGNGRVGLKESNPQQALHISDANPFLRIQESDVTNGFADIGYNSGRLRIRSRADSANAGISFEGQAGTTVTEYGRFNAAGNLGIGTNNPGEPLHIKNSDAKIKLEDADGTNQAGTIFQAGGILALQSRNDTANGSIKFQGYNGTAGQEYARFNASGNFGIGTTTPSHRLTVDTDNNTTAVGIDIGSNASYNFAANSTSGYVTTFNMDNTGLEIGHNSTSRNLALQTGGLDRLTIGGGGSTHVHGNLDVSGADVTITANIIHAGDNNTYFGFHGNDLWRVVTGGLERFEVSNSGIRINDNGADMDFTIESDNDANMFFVDGGNDKIGIGTASPSEKLTVAGGARFNSLVKLYTNAGSTYGISEALRIDNGGGNEDRQFQIYETQHSGAREHIISFNTDITTDSSSAYTYTQGNYGGSSAIRFGNSGQIQFFSDAQVSSGSTDTFTPTEVVRFAQNGRVGIGTTNPSHRLHVLGNSTNQTAVAKIQRVQASASNNTYTFEVDSSAHTSNMTSGGAMAVDVNSGRAFTINGMGNVGIGTSSPSFKLHVDSGTTDVAGYFKSSDNKAAILISDDDTNTYVSAENSKSSIGVNPGSHADNLNILSTGSVGIGTTSPSEKLHVTDTVFIDYPDGSGASLKIGRNDTSNYWEVGHAGGDFRLYNTAGSGSDILFGVQNGGVDQGNRVGIGQPSPGGKLHTAGSNGIPQIIVENTSTTGGHNAKIQFKPSSARNAGPYIMSTQRGNAASDGDIQIGDENGTIATFNFGRVGIGTISPASPLDVVSDSSALGIRVRGRSSDDIGQIDLANNGGTVRSQLQWNNSFFNIKALAAIPMIFYTNGTERMRIQSAGQVGIGTTSPEGTLHVKSTGNGEIDIERASGAKINIQAQSAAGYIGTDTNHVFGLKSNSTVRLKIATNGAITFNDAFTFPTSIGSAGQVLKVPTSGTELIWGSASGGGSGSTLEDNDGDTKIQVEESADEDIIRFDIAGTQKMLLNSTELNLTGDLAVSGNLNITGDINSTSVTNLDVTDKTITVANNAGSAANANGAGIVVDTGTNNPQIIYTNTTDEWDINRDIHVSGSSGRAFKFNAGGALVGGGASGGDTQLIYFGGTVVYYGRSSLGGTVSGHEFRIGGVTKLNVNSSGHTIVSGNMGIGTSSPARRLTVQGGSGDNLPVRIIGGSGTSHGSIEFQDPNTTADYKVTIGSKADDFYIQAGGTEKVRVKSDGKVGIGTSSPAGNLHIKSLNNVGDALLIVEADADNNVESDNPRIELRQDNNLVAGAIYMEGNGGGTATGTIDNSFVLDSKASTGDNGSPIHFATGGLAPNQSGGPTNSTVRMTVHEQGNIGIGTTAPVEKLDVRGHVSFGDTGGAVSTNYNVSSYAVFKVGGSEHYRLDGTGLIVKTRADNSVSQGLVIERSINSDRGYINYNGGGFQFRSTVGDPIVFGETDAEHVRIQPDGNVGIGNSSPPQKLTVNGAVFITDQLTSPGSAGTYTYNGTAVDYSNNGTRYWSWGSGTARGTFNFIQLENDGTNQQTAMSIDTSGNVGVGTSSPQTRLHVESSDGSGIRVSRSGATAYMQLFPAYSNVPTIMGLGAGGLHLSYNSSTDGIRIGTNNNVGIGTTSPQTKLEVNSSNIRISNSNSTIGNLQFYRTGSNNGMEFRGYETLVTLHTIGGGVGEIARFERNTGDVGIGTDGPDARLHVRGSQIVGEAGDTDQAPLFFEWVKSNTGSSGNGVWYKVADISLPNQGYSAIAFSATYVTGTNNYGNHDFIRRHENFITIVRNSGSSANDSPDTATVRGVTADIRVYKTGTGTYELQARGNADNMEYHVEVKVFQGGQDRITPVMNGSTAGTTSGGTAYGVATMVNGSDGIVRYMGVTHSKFFNASSGSATAPSITFEDDTNTGLYRYTGGSEDRLGIATAGGLRVNFGTHGVESSANVYTGNGSAFRNYGGVWAATTGVANNGFYFLNTANSNTVKALELSAAGALTHRSDYVQTAGTWTKQGTNGNVQIAANGNELNFTRNAANYINASGGSSSTLKILQNGGHVLTVNTSKNVGIGTETPSRKLEVGFTGSTYGARFTRTDSAGNSLIEFANNQGVKNVIGFDSGNSGFIVSTGGTPHVTVRNSTGNVGIGAVNPKAKLQVEEYGIDTSSTTTTATTQVAIHTFPIADFRTARFTIQITNTTDSTYHSTEIIAVHDGSTANITEFGEVHTGSSVEATFDSDISSGNFRLLATPASTDSMTFKVVCHSITV